MYKRELVSNRPYQGLTSLAFMFLDHLKCLLTLHQFYLKTSKLCSILQIKFFFWIHLSLLVFWFMQISDMYRAYGLCRFIISHYNVKSRRISHSLQTKRSEFLPFAIVTKAPHKLKKAIFVFYRGWYRATLFYFTFSSQPRTHNILYRL
jgi:hypothetical protein